MKIRTIILWPILFAWLFKKKTPKNRRLSSNNIFIYSHSGDRAGIFAGIQGARNCGKTHKKKIVTLRPKYNKCVFLFSINGRFGHGIIRLAKMFNKIREWKFGRKRRRIIFTVLGVSKRCLMKFLWTHTPKIAQWMEVRWQIGKRCCLPACLPNGF